MAKYLVNYYETYTNSYEIEADSKEEAEQIARDKFGCDYLIDDVIITKME